MLTHTSGCSDCWTSLAESGSCLMAVKSDLETFSFLARGVEEVLPEIVRLRMVGRKAKLWGLGVKNQTIRIENQIKREEMFDMLKQLYSYFCIDVAPC